MFRLEFNAKNIMDFRIPDEAGNQPKKTPICDSLKTTDCLLTALSTDDLYAGLKPNFENVRLSNSAGEFICNFIFYRNLEICKALFEETNCLATGLFVHIPTFKNCSEDKQEAFIK